jgi:MinD superfamily P-loop ATPase
LVLSVVSGKGGAGKTTIATSLAHIFQADYYDLDVDAPNGEYFLKLKIGECEKFFSSNRPLTNPSVAPVVLVQKSVVSMPSTRLPTISI